MKKLLFILFVLSNAVYAQYEDFEIDALVSPKKNGIILTVGGEQADVQGFQTGPFNWLWMLYRSKAEQ